MWGSPLGIQIVILYYVRPQFVWYYNNLYLNIKFCLYLRTQYFILVGTIKFNLEQSNGFRTRVF